MLDTCPAWGRGVRVGLGGNLGAEPCALARPYRWGSIAASSWRLGLAPTICWTTSPFLYRLRVGAPITPYLTGVFGFASTSSLAMVSLPAYSSAICSSTGAIVLQGPHQSAQKSTRTGVSLARTCSSKVASVTVMGAFTVTLDSPLGLACG